jgi:uncharacterized peroxidase-related enzyme
MNDAMMDPSAPASHDAPSPSPEAVAKVHAMAEEALGFVPNLVRTLAAHSPAAARTYLMAMGCVEQQGLLPPAEREAVILTVSRYNDCHYCTRAHALSGAMAGLPDEAIEAIHRGGFPRDPRLRALVRATRLLLDRRGMLEADEIDALREHGIDRAELYEISTIVGLKLFSNYVNHVAQTPLDDEIVQHPRIQSMWDVIGTMDRDTVSRSSTSQMAAAPSVSEASRETSAQA